MKKQEYLTMLGWDVTLWTVLLASEVNNLLSKDDVTGNIFPIADPGGIKAFGEGSYVAKIEYVQKNAVATPPPPPQPPILDGPVIPSPTPIVESKDDIEDAVIVEETKQVPDVISPLLRARIANLVKAGWTDDTIGNITSPDDIVYPYVNIEEMENTDYTNMLKAKPAPKKEPVKKVVETKPEIQEPDPLLEERTVALEAIGWKANNDTSVFVLGTIELPYKRIAEMPDNVFASVIEKYTDKPIKEKVEEVSNKVSETKTEKQKVTPEVKQQTDVVSGDGKENEAPRETITEKPVTEPKEVVEQQAKNKEELDNSENIVPVATVDTVKHFGVADDIIELATAFKKTFYAIALIKAVMEEDLPPSKKMAKVKAAVKNIDTKTNG